MLCIHRVVVKWVCFGGWRRECEELICVVTLNIFSQGKFSPILSNRILPPLPSLVRWHRAVSDHVNLDKLLPKTFGLEDGRAEIDAYVGDKILSLAIARIQIDNMTDTDINVGYLTKEHNSAVSNVLFAHSFSTVLPEFDHFETIFARREVSK